MGEETQSVEVQEHLPSQHGGEEAISNKVKRQRETANDFFSEFCTHGTTHAHKSTYTT